jgi:hypothetical protein
MTNDHDALYALLMSTTKAVVTLKAGIKASNGYLQNTDELTCSCEQSTLTYDGPQVDCDVHGLPSAAFEAGRRQGAEDERDAASIRGDLCRWCLRERQLGDKHGTEIPRSSDPETDPDVACFDIHDQEIPHRSMDKEPF